MTTTVEIKHGPFKGTLVPVTSLRLKVDTDYNSNTSKVTGIWPHNQRMAILWEKFRLEDGYGIEVDCQPSDLQMSTYQNIEGVMVESGPHKTLQFIASLRKAGAVVMQSSTLTPLNVVKAYESGENNAISRLLDHLGLPTAFDLEPGQWKDTDLNASNGAVTVVKPASKAVTPTVVILTPDVAATLPPDDDENEEQEATATSSSEATTVVIEPESATSAAGNDVANDETATTTDSSDPVSKNTRTQLLNLHRRHRRGQPFVEPRSQAEALALIEALDPTDKVADGDS